MPDFETTEMPKAAIYLRVSTEEQALNANGLNAQEDTARAYVARNGWDLFGVFTDAGVTGSVGLEKRPAMLDAIAAIGKGDVLLVAKRDRIGRLEPLPMAMIEAAVRRRGARIVSAAGEGTEDDDPASILMRRMIDAFAEYERLVIKARTKAALRASAGGARRPAARRPTDSSSVPTSPVPTVRPPRRWFHVNASKRSSGS